MFITLAPDEYWHKGSSKGTFGLAALYSYNGVITFRQNCNIRCDVDNKLVLWEACLKREMVSDKSGFF